MASKATEMSAPCSAQRRPAPRSSPCRPDPPVVCPGFGLDRFTSTRMHGGQGQGEVRQAEAATARRQTERLGAYASSRPLCDGRVGPLEDVRYGLLMKDMSTSFLGNSAVSDKTTKATIMMLRELCGPETNWTFMASDKAKELVGAAKYKNMRHLLFYSMEAYKQLADRTRGRAPQRRKEGPLGKEWFEPPVVAARSQVLRACAERCSSRSGRCHALARFFQRDRARPDPPLWVHGRLLFQPLRVQAEVSSPWTQGHIFLLLRASRQHLE